MVVAEARLFPERQHLPVSLRHHLQRVDDIGLLLPVPRGPDRIRIVAVVRHALKKVVIRVLLRSPLELQERLVSGHRVEVRLEVLYLPVLQ